MHARLPIALALASLVAPAAVVAASAAPTGDTRVISNGGVVATVAGTRASLGNGRVARAWSLRGGAVETTGLTEPGKHSWAVPGPDFSINLNGVPTSSTTGWSLASVRPVRPPAQPGRPASGKGAGLLFRYTLVAPQLRSLSIELDRLVALRPGTSVVQTTSTLINHTAGAARISSYSLDEVTGRYGALPVEVQTYHGGSDWRDDYRRISRPSGAFDAEGEVARFGGQSGYFFVSQRRGGAMSRVGRDVGGRTWAGVDWARDLFDFGPILTDPPNYNRLDNPAYPVPVRARVLRPLGTLDLGTSYLGVYSGGTEEAGAEFARAFVGAGAPAYRRSVGLNSFHPWSHGPDMSDANLRHQVDVAKALGIETFMLDDQWQGGPGGESGDWRFDAERFPDRDHDGMPDFLTYLDEQGLDLGLWMSPVEFHGTSQTYADHPGWACAPTGDVTAQIEDDAGLGVWDATNPKFQDYLVGVVDRLVKAYDVREFKFDFMAWVDCGVHDYADYEDAFVAMVRRMERRHPTVTFELDETNDQRSWPFESAALGPSWFDNGHLHGSGPVAKLLHDVWTAAPWVPTWSLGLGVYDDTLEGPYAGVDGVDALFPLAMLTHITFWTDLTTLTDAQRAETSWWIDWYVAHRNSIGPAVYELTSTDPIDGASWAAWQPWDGRAGYVFAFRQSGGLDGADLHLRGVDPSVTYDVVDVRTGADVGTFSGAQLADGLHVELAKYAAAVLSVTPTA